METLWRRWAGVALRAWGARRPHGTRVALRPLKTLRALRPSRPSVALQPLRSGVTLRALRTRWPYGTRVALRSLQALWPLGARWPHGTRVALWPHQPCRTLCTLGAWGASDAPVHCPLKARTGALRGDDPDQASPVVDARMDEGGITAVSSGHGGRGRSGQGQYETDHYRFHVSLWR